MNSKQAWDSMPKKLRIGYKTYRVKELSPLEAEGVGAVALCKMNTDVIAIVPTMVPSEMGNSLLHEIQHAIWHHTGMRARIRDLSEEDIVNDGTNTMCQVIRDNPKLMPWIAEVLK